MDLEKNLEKNFIVNLFFKKKTEYTVNFKDLELGKIIKISSSHMMIPTLYKKMRDMDYLKHFPLDFKKYIKNIYSINKNRNKELLIESEQLALVLKSNKVNFFFTKGCYYLRDGIYPDLGERMIGDIDFIFDPDNKNKIINVLGELGYKNELIYKVWKTKHLKRFTCKNKMFAIEPHTEFLIYRRKNVLPGQYILENFDNGKKKILIKQCILNYMINDYGNLKAIVKYRPIYDYFKLEKKLNFKLKNFENIFEKRFFIILKYLQVHDNNFDLNLFDRIFIFRLHNKEKHKVFYHIDNFICQFIIKTPITFMQLLEFTFNRAYRDFTIKKLFKKLSLL